MTIYDKPETALWRGRYDGDDSLSQRIYQQIELHDLKYIPDIYEKKAFGIIGFKSDEGVKRNQGRIGAAKAPDAIRKDFANLPFHFQDHTVLIDVGNVVCENGNLELAQSELGSAVETILNQQLFPIILGGGHETAYGHYLGVRSFIGEDATLGIINFDAHFDLRNEQIPTSGTMFKQILENDSNSAYLVLGIQPFANTRQLFQTAEDLDSRYLLEEETEKLEAALQAIEEMSSRYDYIMLTLCFDVISSDAAPGVSAPSPFGLHPKTIRNLLRFAAQRKNLLSFDISEVNPLLDENGKTVKLAAFYLAEVIDILSKK